MTARRLLLVDDETAFTHALTRLLQVRGYTVAAVTNGTDALRALGEEAYDAVVLDLKMPGMDGIQTLEEIRQLGLFTETIILTGHGSEEMARRARAMGAADFIAKPCDLELLLAAVERALTQKHRREQKDGLDRMIRG